MDMLFYISGVVAVAATVMVITRSNAVHALLYLIVSLLAVAMVFYSLGSPFVAALEVIIYAGAIMVLFIFAIMMLDLRQTEPAQRTHLLRPRAWIGPVLLALVLLGELAWVYAASGLGRDASGISSPQQVGGSLFGPYALAAELMSLLLLAALVGAYHLARPDWPSQESGRPGGTP
ncbi:MAG: NADH-quinone oxidoreductase subunit J [Planctomycetaceae bacterium]|nr:NADH-quinone oxidoreductase subunit J [Planctomycetaceae bacterium]